MNTPYVITIAAALVIITRLITFRRRAGRYRPGVAILAWLLIVSATCVAIFGPAPGHLAPWLIAAAMVAMAVALIRTGGNVAHLVRPLRRL